MVIMNEIFMPQKFFKLVENEKITHFTAVPTMLNMLLKYRYYNNYDYSLLKIILVGGGKMSFNMLRKLNDRYSSVNFCQTYGQTECSPRVTLLEPIDSIKKIESVGKAIPGVEIIIVDRNGKEVKKEIIGEICVKVYIPTRQSTLHGVLVHDFRRYSARFPVISACGLFRYRYSGFC